MSAEGQEVGLIVALQMREVASIECLRHRKVSRRDSRPRLSKRSEAPQVF
jgi:hypothetical protein